MKKNAVRGLAVVGAVLGSSLMVRAQIATVDATDPLYPQVTYDPSPYVSPPPVPDDPTVVYPDVPTPSAIEGQAETHNTTSFLADGLYFEGQAGATASQEDSSVVQQEPTVTTNDTPPDTYSLSPAVVYYMPPTQPAGPYKALTGTLQFDFGTQTSPVATGWIGVNETTAYGPDTGYGWGDITKVSSRDRGGDDATTRDFCIISGTQFYVDLPNGNYQVTITCGDTQQNTSQIVRANGLLELYTSGARAGSYDTESFPVHVKNGRLMLEVFPYKSGYACHINSLVIKQLPDKHPMTIYVASDSTAAKYSPAIYPLTGWGDRLSKFLTGGVLVDDQAKPGRSTKSFYEEGGLDTICDRIQPGDYLFVMSAINDAAKVPNSSGTESNDPARHTDPSTTYKAYLRLYVNAARQHGATPVFVTSQTKRTYDLYGRFYNSVGAYPQAMKELATELNVPVIDLNQKSIDYLNAVGVDASANIYMFFPSGQYAGWPNGDGDYIHLQDNGATQYAHLIMQGVRELNLQPLAQYVTDTPQP